MRRPRELTYNIVLKALVRCRSLNKAYRQRLTDPRNLSTHFCSQYGDTFFIQFNNPVDRLQLPILTVYDVDHGSQWKWFSLIGSDMGSLCARFSLDIRVSSIIVWNPITNRRRVISDPASPCFPNHLFARGAAVYSFMVSHATKHFRVTVLLKKVVNHIGYTLCVYDLTLSSWSLPVEATHLFGKCSESSVVIGSWCFWINLTADVLNNPFSIISYSFDTCKWAKSRIPPNALQGSSSKLVVRHPDLLYVVFELSCTNIGVHIHRLTLSGHTGLDWVSSMYCGHNYLSYTPSIVKGDYFLGVIHSLTNNELFFIHTRSMVSEIHFLKLHVTGGPGTNAGSLHWTCAVEIGAMFSYIPSLFDLFGYA
ncbi:hypothetical protein PIB30_070431 [Stylosanthes scabra]|uniref:Uncharacterized protein n=1 Tax=Stylosanthes scabra TaxID=79078 RepID=A0ABU6RP05_9FABA|nr:hypothetical protein [Stylosanthes scabra]